MNNDFLLKAQNATFSNAVKSIVCRTSIVEFGIVKEIISDGIVRVAVSVAVNKADVRILTCVLVNPSSSSFMCIIKPKVNDKVIVVFPRRYNANMFQPDFENADSVNNDIITDPYGKGYTPFSGIAILANMFIESQYHNFLEAEDGKISLNLAYSKNDNKNLLVLNTTETGEVSLKSNNVAIDIKADGSVTVIDGNSHSISMTSDKVELKFSDSKKIAISDSGTVINGKLTVK